MQPTLSHPWNLSENAAIEWQSEWARKVLLAGLSKKVVTVAGIDVAYSKHDDQVVAGVVVLDASTLSVIETVVERTEASFPYISGLFSFRELPPVIKALGLIQTAPDLIVCDGHGIAHPRRFGLASHLGLLYDIPSIGCAKSANTPAKIELASTRGSTAGLYLNDEQVGTVLRTQDNVKPVFVSPGHKITVAESAEWVLRLSPEYRLPETTRQADQAVNRALKK